MGSRRRAWRGVALAVGAALAIGACEEKKPAPAAQQAPSVEVAEPTPVLDGYAALADRLGPDAVVAVAWVLPLEAKLTVAAEGPAGERGRALAALERARPASEQLVELSRREMERVPGDIAGNPEAPGWKVLMTAAHVLPADASRCFDAGDHDGALARVAAQARIGAQLLSQSMTVSALGQRHATMAVNKAEALLNAGAKGSSAARAELRAALERLDPDPAKFAAQWEQGTREHLEALRRELGGPDGPRRLAQVIEENGVTAENAGALESMVRGVNPEGAAYLRGAVIIKPEREGVYSAAMIERGLARAEELISRARAALESPDLGAAWAPIAEAMEGDRTQITKLALGAPAAMLTQLRQMDGVRRRVMSMLG